MIFSPKKYNLDKVCKIYDVFDISNNLYNEKEIVVINGFKFSNLKYNLKIKKMLNRPKDTLVIKKLEKILKN